MAESRTRKRTFLSVQHKTAIIEDLKKGFSIKYLTRQYGVSRRDIIHIRRESERLKASRKRRSHLSKHKNRRSLNQEIADRLNTWVQDQQAVGYQLTDPLIQEEEIELSGEQEGTSRGDNMRQLAKFREQYKVGKIRTRRAETATREEIDKTITDVSDEYDNEEELDEHNIANEDSVETFNEEENIAQDEQEEERNIDEGGEKESEAPESYKSQSSLIDEKNADLNMLRDIIKKYAYNNQAVLIMGEAIINILQNNIL